MHNEITNIIPKKQNSTSQYDSIAGATVMQLNTIIMPNEKQKLQAEACRIFLLTFLAIFASPVIRIALALCFFQHRLTECPTAMSAVFIPEFQ